MKRCICLSALLVGLSVTSIAAAAPPATSAPTATAAKPKLVAQASGIGSDVAQTDGTGTGTAPATTAPADGSAPTTSPQPAVSVGTSSPAPAKDAPQEGAEEPKKAPKPRPFAGTQIYATTSMTTATIFRGQQQDYNPTAEQALWLLPRYAINKDFQLRGRLIASYEFTNSDSTRYQNEPTLSDTTVQLFYRGIPAVAGFQPAVALNVGAPTSKLSRARNQIFTPGVSVQLSRGIEHVLGGELFLLATAIYSHPIYSDRQATVVDLRDMQTFQCVGGINCGDLLTGQMNPSDSLAYMALIGGEWGKWAPALLYFGGSQWAYRPTEVMESEVVPGGNNVPVTGAVNPTNVNQSHYFNAFLDYHFNNWFTGEVGYWLRRSALNEAGKYGNPFWDRYQDMRVYLGLNINIDNLMKTLEGGDADAGIVRAQNKKTPFFTF